MIKDDGKSLVKALSRLSVDFIEGRISFVGKANLEQIEIDELKTALARNPEPSWHLREIN